MRAAADLWSDTEPKQFRDVTLGNTHVLKKKSRAAGIRANMKPKDRFQTVAMPEMEVP
jgi:hypothetical protein